MIKAFVVNPTDNVATLLGDAKPGDKVEILGIAVSPIAVNETITLGHKIAVRDIAVNDNITKFGVPIGHAQSPITAGQWVHLHNCVSNFDTRSQTLDLHSGAATDTKYE